jgi:hypothetical protein
MKVVQKIEICFNKNFKNDLNLNLKNINLKYKLIEFLLT